MDLSIVNLRKPNCEYAQYVNGITFPLYYALTELGFEAEILTNTLARDSKNIIFGLQDLPDFPIDTIPKNSIIYNLELISEESKGMRPHYLEALKKFEVWEYSARNFEKLQKDWGITNIKYVPLGYMPQMSCVDQDYHKDIDVLFYGYMNERRSNIIKELEKRGLKAVGVEKVFGAERDFLIARSKVVLNIHYYIPGSLETLRLGYLLANKKLIVSECNSDTEIHSGYEETCIFCPYKDLVEVTASVCKNENLQKKQAQRGFDIFSANKFTDILRGVLEVPDNISSDNKRKMPVKLNVGSCNTFRVDYLNIGTSASWDPDILLDLSNPLKEDVVFNTRRFGEISLQAGYFNKIIASDVIERVANLTQTMTNFLNLLCEGGELHITVPYDLSLGAWQDPTYLRAFNENSWKYYTTGAWALGWRDWRFELKELEYQLSELGQEFRFSGASVNDILRTPRAVESMSVVLKKRKSTTVELLEYDKKHGVFYKHI